MTPFGQAAGLSAQTAGWDMRTPTLRRLVDVAGDQPGDEQAEHDDRGEETDKTHGRSFPESE
ncbi:hypothetical protein GCM10020000_06740 [Streptomyces olivoverticillatus]